MNMEKMVLDIISLNIEANMDDKISFDALNLDEIT
jgi:hypothetical protein